MSRSKKQSEMWALVLAGGDGRRLRELTRRIAGEPIPKQYCRIAGERSMLEATLDRIAPLVAPERTLVIVNRDHLALARPQLAALPQENVLVQPCNRDTGPGLLWSLLEVERRTRGALLAQFPSDHFVANDDAFRASVRDAARVVGAFPDKIGLLGVRPEEPSPEYGYVVPALPLGGADMPAFHVASFQEKPERRIARQIVRDGALWNSFVMVFRSTRMLELLARVRPEDHCAMKIATRSAISLERFYADAERWNFSSDFLMHVAQELVVLRADGLGWSDWGTPQAIERTFAALNRVPPWQSPSAAA